MFRLRKSYKLTASALATGAFTLALNQERQAKQSITQRKDFTKFHVNNPMDFTAWSLMQPHDKSQGIKYTFSNFCVEPQTADHTQASVNLGLKGFMFADCDFFGSNLSKTGNYHNRGFTNCDLRQTKFHYAEMNQALIGSCDAQNADFSHLRVDRDVMFRHTNLTDAKFKSARLAMTTFDFCDMNGVDLQDVHAYVMKLTHARNSKNMNWTNAEMYNLVLDPAINLFEAKSVDGLIIHELNLDKITPRQARALAEGGAVWGPDAAKNRLKSLEERQKIARQQLRQAGILNKSILTYFVDKVE